MPNPLPQGREGVIIITLLYPLGVMWGMKKIVSVIITLCIVFLMVGAVSAENNETIPYRYSEQYEQDVNYWYNYYKEQQGDMSNLRTTLYDYLVNSSMTWEEKQELILAEMGWDYRLDIYFSDKCSKDYKTGEVTYDLGIGNWWANLFGNGVDESTLPQSMGEGEGLYKVYMENYREYIQALHDAGDPQ